MTIVRKAQGVLRDQFSAMAGSEPTMVSMMEAHENRFGMSHYVVLVEDARADQKYIPVVVPRHVAQMVDAYSMIGETVEVEYADYSHQPNLPKMLDPQVAISVRPVKVFGRVVCSNEGGQANNVFKAGDTVYPVYGEVIQQVEALPPGTGVYARMRNLLGADTVTSIEVVPG